MKYGTLDDLKKLIKMGAEINGSTVFDRTCLHLAAFNGRLDMIHELIGNGIRNSNLWDNLSILIINTCKMDRYRLSTLDTVDRE
jgi:ankyrin repeat protein